MKGPEAKGTQHWDAGDDNFLLIFCQPYLFIIVMADIKIRMKIPVIASQAVCVTVGWARAARQEA